MYIYKYIYVCEKRIYKDVYADIIEYKHIFNQRSSHAPFIKCLRRFSLQKVQIPIKNYFFIPGTYPTDLTDGPTHDGS